MFEDIASAVAEWFGFFDDSLPDAYWGTGEGAGFAVQGEGMGVHGGGSSCIDVSPISI